MFDAVHRFTVPLDASTNAPLAADKFRPVAEFANRTTQAKCKPCEKVTEQTMLVVTPDRAGQHIAGRLIHTCTLFGFMKISASPFGEKGKFSDPK
jgi:hypothetical protein